MRRIAPVLPRLTGLVALLGAPLLLSGCDEDSAPPSAPVAPTTRIRACASSMAEPYVRGPSPNRCSAAGPGRRPAGSCPDFVGRRP